MVPIFLGHPVFAKWVLCVFCTHTQMDSNLANLEATVKGGMIYELSLFNNSMVARA